MDTAIAEFIQYLIGTKNYSDHTATAYDKDIRDFISFYENFTGGALYPGDMSRADTLCFRSFLVLPNVTAPLFIFSLYVQDNLCQ